MSTDLCKRLLAHAGTPHPGQCAICGPGPCRHSESTMASVDSTSDDRTANNAVRHAYRVLTDEEKAQMVRLKDLGAAFIAECQKAGTGREISLAITNAEQAVMWAVKHVTA
jgi:hypothetical protein